MKMVFTETAMHVLASIINGLTVVISVVVVVVMVVAVSIVIVITKHGVRRRSVTVVVPIGVATTRVLLPVTLHGHRVLRMILLGVMVVAHRGIWVVPSSSSVTTTTTIDPTVSVHGRRSGSVRFLRQRERNGCQESIHPDCTIPILTIPLSQCGCWPGWWGSFIPFCIGGR